MALLESQSVPVRVVNRVAELALDRLHDKVTLTTPPLLFSHIPPLEYLPLTNPRLPTTNIPLPPPRPTPTSLLPQAVNVRKNALALLTCVLDNNPFAGSLDEGFYLARKRALQLDLTARVDDLRYPLSLLPSCSLTGNMYLLTTTICTPTIIYHLRHFSPPLHLLLYSPQSCRGCPTGGALRALLVRALVP